MQQMISRSRQPCRTIPRALALALAALAGCGDRMVMTERTSFNLAIAVQQDPATPLSVNAGLDRKIMGFVPARSTTRGPTGQPVGTDDAVSLFSGFDLRYKDTGGIIGGDLSILTQFASGAAAIALANNPNAVRALIDVNNVMTLTGTGERPIVEPPLPPSDRIANPCSAIERRLRPADLNRIRRALCLDPGDATLTDRDRAAIVDFYRVDASKGQGRARPPEEGPQCLSPTAVNVLTGVNQCDKQYRSYFERMTFSTPDDVKTLQGLLGVRLTGVIDPDTRKAVMAKQTSAGQAPTGIIDEAFVDLF